jgi:hypothetical protein
MRGGRLEGCSLRPSRHSSYLKVEGDGQLAAGHDNGEWQRPTWQWVLILPLSVTAQEVTGHRHTSPRPHAVTIHAGPKSGAFWVPVLIAWVLTCKGETAGRPSLSPTCLYQDQASLGWHTAAHRGSRPEGQEVHRVPGHIFPC